MAVCNWQKMLRPLATVSGKAARWAALAGERLALLKLKLVFPPTPNRLTRAGVRLNATAAGGAKSGAADRRQGRQTLLALQCLRGQIPARARRCSGTFLWEALFCGFVSLQSLVGHHCVSIESHVPSP